MYSQWLVRVAHFALQPIEESCLAPGRSRNRHLTATESEAVLTTPSAGFQLSSVQWDHYSRAHRWLRIIDSNKESFYEQSTRGSAARHDCAHRGDLTDLLGKRRIGRLTAVVEGRVTMEAI